MILIKWAIPNHPTMNPTQKPPQELNGFQTPASVWGQPSSLRFFWTLLSCSNAKLKSPYVVLTKIQSPKIGHVCAQQRTPTCKSSCLVFAIQYSTTDVASTLTHLYEKHRWYLFTKNVSFHIVWHIGCWCKESEQLCFIAQFQKVLE